MPSPAAVSCPTAAPRGRPPTPGLPAGAPTPCCAAARPPRSPRTRELARATIGDDPAGAQVSDTGRTAAAGFSRQLDPRSGGHSRWSSGAAVNPVGQPSESVPLVAAGVGAVDAVGAGVAAVTGG